MITFAVWHEGIDEGQGRWVLDADHESVLLANDDGSLYWQPLAECKLVRAQTPDHPVAVIPVAPQPAQNGLVMPEPNRMMRRNGNN